MKVSQLLVIGTLITGTVAETTYAAVTSCNKLFCTLPTVDCGANGEFSNNLRTALTTRPVDANGNPFVNANGSLATVTSLNITFTGKCIGPFVISPDAFGPLASQINLSGATKNYDTPAGSVAVAPTLSGQGTQDQILIVASSTVNVSSATFTNANGRPQARVISGIPYVTNGGAIANFGDLSITNCKFQNNTVANTFLNNNFISGSGGAIYNSRVGSCNNGFDCNKSGSLQIKYSVFTNNNTQGGHGAAVYNAGGTLVDPQANNLGVRIESSSFSSNGASASSVIYNTANAGGTRGTTISTGNSFYDAFPGLIEFGNVNGDVYITNTTIAETTSGGIGIGISNVAARNVTSRVYVTYSTIAHKLIGVQNAPNGGTAQTNFSNSIIFANGGNSCVGGSFNSDANSITDITTAVVNNAVVFTNPCGPNLNQPTRVSPAALNLGEFADYGGGLEGVPLRVIPLNPGSFAAFFGDPNVCALTQFGFNVGSIDQRGTQRPQPAPTNPPLTDPGQQLRAALGWCDVGAFQIPYNEISFGGLFTRIYGDPPFPINTVTTSNPIGDPSLSNVTYSSTTPPICAVQGSTATILSAGDCIIQASTTSISARIPPPSPPCSTGRSCTTTADCTGSDVCNNNVCVVRATTCTDLAKNGNETDVDCGGSCGGCATGKTCLRTTDCAAGNVCTDGVCSAPTTCVGPPCNVESVCASNNDCQTGSICAGNVCLIDQTCETITPIPSYYGSTKSQTYKILPAALTIKGPSGSMVYGGTVPELAPTYTGLKYGQTQPATPPSCPTNFSATTPVAGSPYTTNCSGAADANYTISYEPGSFVVNKKPLTIRTNTGGTMNYGGTPLFIYAVSINGFENGDDSTVLANLICGYYDTVTKQVKQFDATTPAGTYQTACTATAANYVVLPPPSNCVFPSTDPACTFATVLPQAMNITASSGAFIYGDTPPVITPIYFGAARPLLPPTCSTTATSASHVAGNPYPSKCSGASDPNYAITYTDGTVTVNPAPLTIAATPANAIQFFGTVPKITPTYTGFKNGDNAKSLTTPATCSTNTVGLSAVAGNPYMSMCSGAVSTDYTFIYVAGVVNVQAGLLNVVASSPTILYGEPIPAITPIYLGLGVVPPAQVTTPTCTTTATSTSEPGTYTTTCVGAAIDNFIITYTSGVLTIKKDPTITTLSEAPGPLSGETNTVTLAVRVESRFGTPSGSVEVAARTGESCKVVLQNGAGTCQITFATRVLNTLFASYLGDAHFDVSTSQPLYLGVVQTASTDNPNPPMLSDPGCDSTGQSDSISGLLPWLLACALLAARALRRKRAS